MQNPARYDDMAYPTPDQLATVPAVDGEVEFVDLPGLTPLGMQLCLVCSTPVYTSYSYGARHVAWHAALAALGS